jgi:hypothetical protein
MKPPSLAASAVAWAAATQPPPERFALLGRRLGHHRLVDPRSSSSTCSPLRGLKSPSGSAPAATPPPPRPRPASRTRLRNQRHTPAPS